ncbi:MULTISPECIES: hypothetical protein [unclassified Dysgonomonas]|uniref:hypothetical protein n=1 Tax=unclassified Dysgonomonas TaxID=2630389 RepID=UPI000683242D|nr:MULTISPECIES: hypothetical protein [unclassified Dysgonomonas]MBD8347957.1 hypothetical protein [Dysgonomonas sp. HGC4]MBF0575632.1 hypothetical protein [Dysgonomonas sp. GY617]
MNEYVINYNDSKSQKTLFFIVGGYAILLGLYQSVMQALANTFTFDFFASLVLIVLGAILILNATVWAARPIFIMNSDSIYVKMPNQKSVYKAEWISIREIALGISYLKMLETDGKQYTVDISGLKYDDLKKVKSQVIEICESKSIPYKND